MCCFFLNFAYWCRPDALDKFGVVNVQMHRLSQELRPLLHYYAVHPKVHSRHH